MGWDIALFSRVRAKLQRAAIRFDEGKTLGGFEPDFIVTAPDGRLFILELKPRYPTDLERAVRQAERMCAAVDVDEALVVVPESAAKDRPLPVGVVTANSLPDTLKRKFEVSPRRRRKSAPSPKRVSAQVFVAMPFDEKYDDVYAVAMTYAAKAIGAKAYRIDKDDFVGDIAEKIKIEIAKNVALIADISEARPNVLYEAGYAHAVGLPAVHISSTLDNLPFDVSHWNTMDYKLGKSTPFVFVARRLREIMKKCPAA